MGGSRVGAGACMAQTAAARCRPPRAAVPDALCSPCRGYKAERPQQDPPPAAGSLGAPPPSCPSSAAGGHAARRGHASRPPRPRPRRHRHPMHPASPAPPPPVGRRRRGRMPQTCFIRERRQTAVSFRGKKTKTKHLRVFNRFLHPQDSRPAASRPNACPVTPRAGCSGPQHLPRSHFVQLRDPVSTAGGTRWPGRGVPVLLRVN